MPILPLWALVVVAAVLVISALLTWRAIFWARARGMLDQPGHRRSHLAATPRGGGVGLVVAACVGVVPALLALPKAFSITVTIAVVGGALAVALVGWLDDRITLGVRPRMAVHVLASAWLAAAVWGAQGGPWWWMAPSVLVCAWSINLHNFMDGIDALLGLQAAFVALAFAALSWAAGQLALTMAGAVLAAACAGFLLFNWPPARIFMGDVGSGCIGFFVFALGLLLCVRVPDLIWPVLIVCSAFAVDATLTLLWRMGSGKRWYTAHREHLYQWLVRLGWTHRRTGCVYMLWNLIVAAPLAVVAFARPESGPWLCATVLVAGGCLWWGARHACLRRIRRTGGRHAA